MGKKGHIFGYVKPKTTEGYIGIRSLDCGGRLLGFKIQLSHLLGTRSLERCQEYIKHYINTFYIKEYNWNFLYNITSDDLPLQPLSRKKKFTDISWETIFNEEMFKAELFYVLED